MITATIITIGDELLIGQTIDTNSAWIAQEFNKIGIAIKRRIAISDQREEILKTLSEATALSEIVITTGGLGPTNDDITKDCLCAFFDSDLVCHKPSLEHITQFFASRNRELLPVNIEQANVPDKCTVLMNTVGTAPGMHFKKDKTHYFSMPGVPFEMKLLVEKQIIPILQKEYKLGGLIHQTIVTSGKGESFLANELVDFEKQLPHGISMAYLPNFLTVKIRLSGEANMQNKINTEIKTLKAKLGDLIISETDQTLEEILFSILKDKKLTLSIAESCTGGSIASKLVSLSGSSEVFMGSVVTYSVLSKQNILGVKKESIEEHGVVSKEVAIEMSTQVKEKFTSTVGIATTGFLEGAEQYFYASVAINENVITKRFSLPYGRKLNSNLATSLSLQLAIQSLIKKSSL